MNAANKLLIPVTLFSLTVLLTLHGCGGGDLPREALVARGSYLVNSVGCTDCHTPHVLGPNGPEPDVTRHLSGHPETLALPAAPQLPEGPWVASIAGSMTAWAGPWGTSFTANLTPDAETGLGSWTAETFKQALRTGRHMGVGRPILPPMPWPVYGKLTDQDLDAIFAYLQSIPAIHNRVPEPLPPVSR
ncbi:MAG: c-type cytochrome [Planctomycetes bacterium]|nr:c-type cytochrome [Planctomycetota bacterium]